MLKPSLKPFLLSVALATTASCAMAQIAQEPLLNKPNTVAPNLTMILDTSGSMAADYIYQYGTLDPSGMGPQGPGTLTRAQYSPDVNRIYYDPRTRYEPRVNYNGTTQTPNAPTAASAGASGTTVVWSVYFRNSTVSAADTGASGEYYNPYPHNAALVVAGAPTLTYPNKVTKTYLTTAGTKFPKYLDRSDCAANYCTATEEAQNHSNWKKWYSTRGEMMKTGLGYAFQPLLDNSIRLGWSTISNVNTNSTLDRGVSSYDGATGGTKDLFFTWLYSRTFANGTPNLVAVDRIGKYYQRTDSDGPWSSLPNPASTGIATVTATGTGAAELPANHASCRRSFSMLLTDGYWNGTQPSTAGNADNLTTTIPSDGTNPAYTYTPVYPYKGATSNTLADLAMYYWLKDARPDLLNRVPKINTTTTQNPSYWQNVSFYAVTLGVDGQLSQTPGTLANLTAGTTLWPTPVANDPSTIDDTWHATINARGELLNASNSNELTSGLKGMFATIAGTAQTLSGVAVSTTALKSGTRKYKPTYVSGTWIGNVVAVALDPTTANETVPAVNYWRVESGTANVAPYDPISTIPAPASRNIWVWNGTSAVTFNAANTGLATDLVDYLKGDSTNEGRKGGIYRNRESKLGDIINSSPVFVKDNVNMGYDKLLPLTAFGTGSNNYAGYLATKATREGVLFVGANDGMLHGFRDSTGGEVFAYVPKAVVPNLYKLSDPAYGTSVLPHQYFVDGPISESDAFLSGAWKNILTGTTGAGAKSVFALNVTTPLSMSSGSVLWEVNSSTSGFSELGYVLSDVQTGITQTGDWVAIFGNGYGSASGEARLFVVNLATGALIKDLSTGVAGNNGLSGVRLVRDTTNRIVGAYAGDLKGNMWKFDLMGATTSDWKVGLSGSPLYNATDAPIGTGLVQPITVAPTVFSHPNGGYVVVFGTGKFFETTDAISPYQSQRLYGVWDAQAFGVAGAAPAGAALTSAALTTQFVQQTISPFTVGVNTYYKISTGSVVWGNGLTGTRGWYIDLPNNGERDVYPPVPFGGTTISVDTLTPVSTGATDACTQTGSGQGWTYVLDGLTGSGFTTPIFDTNGDNVIDAADCAGCSGYQAPPDGRSTVLTAPSGSGGSGGSGGTDEDIPASCIGTNCYLERWIVDATGIGHWVKIFCGQKGVRQCILPGAAGIKSREWRQLFMR